MTKTIYHKLTRLVKQGRLYEEELIRVIQAAWPVGSRITWNGKGPFPQSGSVVMHGYGNRLKVRNERTNKEYWIDFLLIDW